MKIPNKQNGKNIIYVQLKDLYAVLDIKNNIPDEIKTQLEHEINDTLKENDFIQFDQPRIIEFFNSIDWILNYKKFAKSKDHEIEYEYMRAAQRLSLFKSSLEFTPKEESTIREYKISNHKMSDIKQALQSIVNNNVNIPLNEDSDAPIFYLENNQDYKIQASLNPNVFVIRKLNQTVASLDAIDYYELKEFIKLLKKQDCEISLELDLNDFSVIICKVSPIPIMQVDKPKKKRKFFNKKSKHKANID